MPSYRIDLAYDGTGFRGYARQDGQRTIQAISKPRWKPCSG